MLQVGDVVKIKPYRYIKNHPHNCSLLDIEALKIYAGDKGKIIESKRMYPVIDGDSVVFYRILFGNDNFGVLLWCHENWIEPKNKIIWREI